MIIDKNFARVLDAHLPIVLGHIATDISYQVYAALEHSEHAQHCSILSTRKILNRLKPHLKTEFLILGLCLKSGF